MNDHKIYIPVTGSTVVEFIGNITKTIKHSNFLELRLDSINGINSDSIKVIYEFCQNLKKTSPDTNIIATLRSKKENGMGSESKSELPKIERLGLLNQILNCGFDYVDIELSTLKEYKTCKLLDPKAKKPKKKNLELRGVETFELDLNDKNEKTNLIISHYNPNNTPNYRALKTIEKQMCGYVGNNSQSILKIEAKINEQQDSNNLIRLLTSSNNTLITIGMNSKLMMTLPLILGSYCTFAQIPVSLDTYNSNTADYITTAEIHELLDLLTL
jgi:3-dehydroquinate dehydratase